MCVHAGPGMHVRVCVHTHAQGQHAWGYRGGVGEW